MIDRFTEKAKEAIGLAADAAEDLGHTYVGTELRRGFWTSAA